MADAYGKLTGRPGDLHRHARPGRDARVGRRAHRVPGLDAADPARRPGRAGHARPGGVPGGRLPRHVRRAREVGRADRRAPSACRSTSHRAFTTATSGRPGPVVLALPEDMLAEEVRGRGRAAVRAAAGAPGRGRPRAPARAARRREAAVRDRRRRRLDGAGRGGLPRLRGGERAPGRRRRSAARTTSTTPRASTSATSASASTRSSRRACATPTCCSSSARASASRRRAATRSSSPAGRARPSCTSTPHAEELGRVYQPALGIVSGSPEFAAAARALEPVDRSALARRGRAGARRLPREPAAHGRARATSRWAR